MNSSNAVFVCDTVLFIVMVCACYEELEYNF
jgi:hypothetical protein